MAENIPNIPSGAVPPKKETGKVQPKKETVRINLPPKPSAAAPAHPPSAPRATAAAPAGPRPAPAAARPAPASMPARPGVSTLDTILAIAAAVIGVLALFSTLNNMFEWIWK
jgi:hypothetical protein